jgi:hypothetical protein
MTLDQLQELVQRERDRQAALEQAARCAGGVWDSVLKRWVPR